MFIVHTIMYLQNLNLLFTCILQKLQKVGHGVMRLAKRQAKNKGSTVKVVATASDYLQCNNNHMAVVRDLVIFQHNHNVQVGL